MTGLSDHSVRKASPTAMSAASVHAAQTSDVDEQAALLRGWNQSYDQISTGSFNGSFLEIEFGELFVFRETTSCALHQKGYLPTGAIAVGTPLALRGNSTFCGQRCDGRQLHVFSGNDAFEFFSPEGLDIAGLVLPRELLERALDADQAETIAQKLASPHLRAVGTDAAAHVRRTFLDVIEILSRDPECAGDKLRLAAMTRDAVDAVVAALWAGEGERVEVSPARRARLVREARALVMNCPDSVTTVEELCRALEVSRRALQLSFQEVLGCKPTQYLRAVRMNGARRAMKDVVSVTEAATLWGFWHFGRFAQDYKAMFGELPSETMRRHHGARR